MLDLQYKNIPIWLSFVMTIEVMVNRAEKGDIAQVIPHYWNYWTILLQRQDYYIPISLYSFMVTVWGEI